MRNLIISLLLLTRLSCLAQSMIGHDCILPAITGNPVSVTQGTTSNVTFSVTATRPVSYQWQTNGVAITDFTGTGGASGSLTSTLTLTNLPLAYNGYLIGCVVGNGCGSVTSSSATLTVTNTPTGNHLLNSLTGVWEMEEGNSANRLDSSGNGHTLVDIGNVQQDIVRIQGSASASLGNHNSALTNADAAFQATTKFTVMFWFYPTGGQDGLFQIDRWGIGNVWAVFGQNGTLAFLAQNPTGGNSGIAQSTIAISGANLNKWHLCFAGFDSVGNVDWISIDGETIQTAANANGALKSNSEWLALFDTVANAGTGNSLIKIDEAAIWENRTLTQSDITTVIGTFNFSTQSGTPLFFSSWTN